MSFVLVTIVAFAVAISVLVAVHEFGHFWVARRLGFQVLRFSIGFGKPLLRRVGRDGVEYVLSAIPLGGYVKLADEREAPVAPEDVARAFNRRPVWQRILVLVAGAGANFLFAVVAFWVLFMAGVPGLKPVVREVRADSIAARAGLRAGDEIIAVGGEAVATTEAARIAILSQLIDGGPVSFGVRRAGSSATVLLDIPAENRRALTVPEAWPDNAGFAFLGPHFPAVVGTLVPGGAAAAAGLRLGDRIVTIDGAPVDDFIQFRNRISALPGATVVLGLQRGGAELRIPLVVRGEREQPETGGRLVGRVGIGPGGEPAYPPGLRVIERHGPIGAVVPAIRKTWEASAITLKFLRRMLTGDVSLKNVNGPISIANYAGIFALEGVTAFLTFLAGVSISLGIMNLLPIPLLDGGQVVYQVAEGLRGRPLSQRVQSVGQQVGIALLVLLMSLAIYNDIAAHFG